MKIAASAINNTPAIVDTVVDPPYRAEVRHQFNTDLGFVSGCLDVGAINDDLIDLNDAASDAIRSVRSQNAKLIGFIEQESSNNSCQILVEIPADTPHAPAYAKTIVILMKETFDGETMWVPVGALDPEHDI